MIIAGRMRLSEGGCKSGSLHWISSGIKASYSV
jgi:hypothetical protein